MKIIIPFSYYYPEQCAGISIIDDLMHAFVKYKIETMLYVPTPTRNVPQNVIYKADETKCGGLLKIKRFRMYREEKNPISRAFRYLLCEINFLYYLLKNDYDIAFIDSTPPIQGLKLNLIKVIKKKKIVYNLQDIFPDSLVGAGMTRKGSLLWKIGRVIEDFTYRNCDKIIVISEDFKRNIMAKGVPEDKIEVIYNWVDENAVVPIAKDDNVLYDEFSLPKDKFYVVYAGNFGNAQNIDVIIRAAEQLKEHQDIQFLLFGTGGLIDDFKKLVSDLHLDNVRFFPLQPYNRVSYVYSLGSVGIVSCKKGIGKGAMPSKTWSIMSAGTPVVANYDTDTDLQRIITSHNLGVFSEADNVQELADAILYMYNNPSLCEEYGRNARRYVEENLTKDVGTSKYIEVVKSVVNK